MYTLYSSTQDSWEGMQEALKGAQQTIIAEFFTFVDDSVGTIFLDIIKERAAKGVSVVLLFDGIGSLAFSRATVSELLSLGIDIQFFHTIGKGEKNLRKRFVSRTHRKILIIDEKIGFIGGVNIREIMQEWKDFCLQITDKNHVAPLIAACINQYKYNGGVVTDLPINTEKYKNVPKKFPELIYYFDQGEQKKSFARKKFIDMVKSAKDEVLLFTPYYFPDTMFSRVLCQIAKQGISVQLYIPEMTDVYISSIASYTRISRLLRAGVQVHFFSDMVHAKGVIVDQKKVLFGSSNIDLTSFYDNFEADVLITNTDIVKQFHQTILTWKKNSKEIKKSEWKNRSLFKKIRDYCVLMIYRLWHWRIKFHFLIIHWRNIFR